MMPEIFRRINPFSRTLNGPHKHQKRPRSFMIRVRKLGFKFQLGLIYRENWTGIWFTEYCIKLPRIEAHGGVLDCHFYRTNLVIYVFLSWVGKMINIDLFRRKSFGCLTRVVHKSSWAKLKPRHATPQKEINIGKHTTSSSEMKYIFYSPNTTHEWFRFKKRFEVR